MYLSGRVLAKHMSGSGLNVVSQFIQSHASVTVYLGLYNSFIEPFY